MADMQELTTAFTRACRIEPGALRVADLEGELLARLDAGRAAWPEIQVDPSRFAAHVGERTTDALPPLALAADLYLACACAAGSSAAIAAFQRAFRDGVAGVVRRTDPSPTFVDDVMQALNVRLFVKTAEAAPAIEQYAGRASLRGWVLTAAKRTALNLRRAKGDQPHEDIDSGVRELGSAAGPELALLKARYKAEFEESLRVGLATLSDRDRSLLVLHLVNGLTLAQLAPMNGVSITTAFRWLAAAREALFEATRAALTERLRVTPSEYESILALVRSQLDVSIIQLFGGRAAPAGS
jgi:RNA polymerase sigma-70 factor (ECF subfamily)